MARTGLGVGFASGMAACCLVWAIPAAAAPARSYDIAAQDLAAALDAFAAASGREVVAASPVVAGRQASTDRSQQRALVEAVLVAETSAGSNGEN